MSEGRATVGSATVAVLDTNVWLDWLVFADPRVDPLRAAAARGSLRPIACRRCRDELANVLARPRLIAQASRVHGRRGTPVPSAQDALRQFDAYARFAAETPVCALRCTDQDDQHLIDLAVGHQARWLFSRDRAVLALSRRAATRYDIVIAPPECFIDAPDGATPRAPQGESHAPTIAPGENVG